MFERAAEVGEELVEGPAAADVHQLRPEADAQGRQPPPLDLGQQGRLERLPERVDPFGVGVPRLAVSGGVEVVAAGEQDAVEAVDVGGDERHVGLVGQQHRQAAGPLDGGGVLGPGQVSAGRVVAVGRHADGRRPGVGHRVTGPSSAAAGLGPGFERLGRPPSLPASLPGAEGRGSTTAERYRFAGWPQPFNRADFTLQPSPGINWRGDLREGAGYGFTLARPAAAEPTGDPSGRSGTPWSDRWATKVGAGEIRRRRPVGNRSETRPKRVAGVRATRLS